MPNDDEKNQLCTPHERNMLSLDPWRYGPPGVGDQRPDLRALFGYEEEEMEEEDDLLDQLPGMQTPNVKGHKYPDELGEEEEPTPELDNEEAEIEADIQQTAQSIMVLKDVYADMMADRVNTEKRIDSLYDGRPREHGEAYENLFEVWVVGKQFVFLLSISF